MSAASKLWLIHQIYQTNAGDSGNFLLKSARLSKNYNNFIKTFLLKQLLWYQRLGHGTITIFFSLKWPQISILLADNDHQLLLVTDTFYFVFSRPKKIFHWIPTKQIKERISMFQTNRMRWLQIWTKQCNLQSDFGRKLH